MKLDFTEESEGVYSFSLIIKNKEYTGTYTELSEAQLRGGVESIIWDEVPDDWEDAENLIESTIQTTANK